MPNIVTPGLTFDAEAHAYVLAGCPLPSVTQILAARGLIDDSHFTAEARDRGTAVHAAVHYLHEGELDAGTIDPRIDGYLDAYRKFRMETDFEPLVCEASMGSAKLGYAGTMDLLGWMRGVDGLAEIDIKTGAHQRWHFVQLAAYDELVGENAEHLGLHDRADLPQRRMTLELHKDGTYRLREIDRAGRETIAFYRARWREALNLSHFIGSKAA